MSAFRSGHGCQTALLKIIEDWKKALDDNKCVAAILMDLSKAFDCLPHNLLLLKLKTYGCPIVHLIFYLVTFIKENSVLRLKMCVVILNICIKVFRTDLF